MYRSIDLVGDNEYNMVSFDSEKQSIVYTNK